MNDIVLFTIPAVVIPLVATLMLVRGNGTIAERHHSHHDTYLIANTFTWMLVFAMIVMGSLGILLGWLCTLDVFTSDKTAAAFFKESSALLTSRLLPALSLIGLHEFDTDVQMLVTMFDENDETTSLDPKKIAAADEAFAAGDLLTKIKLQGAEYIKQHPAQFVAKDD